MRHICTLVIFLLLSACTWTGESKTLLMENAPYKRQATFNIAYQILARCFNERRDLRIAGGGLFQGAGDQFVIYPDQGLAELTYTDHNRYYGERWYELIEFRGDTPDQTTVAAFAGRSEWLDRHWATIEICTAAHSSPAQR